MFKFKKIFLTLILLILVFSTAAEAAEIEFWTINLSPTYDDFFRQKISEYEENNPDTEIIWEDVNFSAVNQKLRYRIAEGNAPEVVNLSPQLMTPLLKEDLLFAVSNLNENFAKGYYPKLWENGRYQDKYYAFPWYLSSKLMIYNEEIFKIAGLDPDSPAKTKKELYKKAEKITSKTGVYAFMPQIKIQSEFLEAGIELLKEENGKAKAAFNTKKAEKIIKNYQSLVQKKVIPRDSLSSSFNIALERYKNNDLAILFIPPQFLDKIAADSDYLRDVSRLAAMPRDSEEVIDAALMNLVIPKKANNKEKAADFAHFISSSDSQFEFSQLSSVLPSAVVSEEKIASITEKNYSDKSQLSFTKKADKILYSKLNRYQDLTFVHSQSDRLIKIMEEQFRRAFAGKITAAEALNIMEEKWNQILNK